MIGECDCKDASGGSGTKFMEPMGHFQRKIPVPSPTFILHFSTLY